MCEKSFKMRPWIRILILIAALLLVFDFDPVGRVLNSFFGNGTDEWAIKVLVATLIIYSFIIATKEK